MDGLMLLYRVLLSIHFSFSNELVSIKTHSVGGLETIVIVVAFEGDLGVACLDELLGSQQSIFSLFQAEPCAKAEDHRSCKHLNITKYKRFEDFRAFLQVNTKNKTSSVRV